jgi:hypothetical protein
MPVESLPWSIQGQSHPATVARNAQAGLLGVPAAAVSPAVQILTAGGGHGVVSAGDLAVTQNGTPNMSVNVAAGRAFIRGTETASLNQGVYSFFNDGAVNLAVAAADPTNPRRDLVIAQVRDSNYSGGVNDARLTVVTGTPAASPSDPTPPANALVLARIAVAAGATSVVTANITDLRTRATGLGGVQVCTSTTRPSGASLSVGNKIFETDTMQELTWMGASWLVTATLGAWSTYTPTLTQSGTVTATITRATWARYGRTIHFQVSLNVTGNGAANNFVTVSLPVAASASGFIVPGGGYLTDAAPGPANYAGITYLATATTAGLQSTNSTALGLLGGAGTPFAAALAPGDGYSISGTYEAAA